MIEIRATEDYDRLVPFFIENGLEFSEEDPTPTDLVRCWDAVDEGKLIGGFVLAKRDGEFICDGIAVDPEYRDRQLGKELLQIGIEETLKTARALETRFKRYDLVICDEFGYMACDKEGGELLFNHLSLRTDTKATIITTNLSFDRWGEIIKDKILANALVDRITHNAYLVNMNGVSYRLKETKNFNQKLQKKDGK